jgi:hypothetical protein
LVYRIVSSQRNGPCLKMPSGGTSDLVTVTPDWPHPTHTSRKGPVRPLSRHGTRDADRDGDTQTGKYSKRDDAVQSLPAETRTGKLGRSYGPRTPITTLLRCCYGVGGTFGPVQRHRN